MWAIHLANLDLVLKSSCSFRNANKLNMETGLIFFSQLFVASSMKNLKMVCLKGTQPKKEILTSASW